jgi:hypothetical protein
MHSFKAFLLSFLPTPCWATVFLKIIQFARFHVHHRSAVSFDANTWRPSIMHCSCGFILQSICQRYISCYVGSVHSFSSQIFWSSVYYNILKRYIIVCFCCETAGRNKGVESFNNLKMASKVCKDHCRHTDCFGENLWRRNFCSVTSPLVCDSPDDVTVNRTWCKGCRMTDLTFRDGTYDWLQSFVFRHNYCVLRLFDNTR